MLAVGTLIVGQAILLEATLSFLGLSSADLISWGRMLNCGQRLLFNAPWLSIFPGAAIFLTVVAPASIRNRTLVARDFRQT